MSGKLYGVGVGPGDPELLTLKALRLIKENQAIAVPGNDIYTSVAYKIVKGAYEELDKKTLFPVAMPMTKDPAVLQANHEKAADDVEKYLKEGQNVVFLTLGDPTVYSTYLYVHKRILKRGYEAEIVSGITSFCAVAARLNMGLVEMAEPLHVIPATYKAQEMDQILELPGTKVLMKTGKKMQQVRESILNSGQDAVMIENCGMEDEKIYRSAEEIPESSGYYSLIIVKENQQK
ncbi:MAG TPA: precorrin-2 C(20)-methyltransferase [Candidatus Blautia ornithocaccae]|nr:precorrin-2 C(20)-methyltransferase [Candidatus Blautia ornithocaccae]